MQKPPTEMAAEEVEGNKGCLVKQPPPFLEVTFKSTGKIRRFAAGTDARFALSWINQKLGYGNPRASHIEAFKEGEEPVIFGLSSVLVDYGDGWMLQAVPMGYEELEDMQPASCEKLKDCQPAAKQSPVIPRTACHCDERKSISGPRSDISSLYFGKIVKRTTHPNEAFCAMFAQSRCLQIMNWHSPNSQMRLKVVVRKAT